MTEEEATMADVETKATDRTATHSSHVSASEWDAGRIVAKEDAEAMKCGISNQKTRDCQWRSRRQQRLSMFLPNGCEKWVEESVT